MTYNLGFGNSVAVREAFLIAYNKDPISFFSDNLLKFDYPDHSGDSTLIEITRQILKRQLDLEYKHILLTNGATGGAVISLRAYSQMKYKYVHTRNAPYYIRYPNMISASGLLHVKEDFDIIKDESVILLDMPSNPLGITGEYSNKGKDIPVVLDGAYLNNIYTNGNIEIPKHGIMVGSYSKLLGINGIRVGWIALNDTLLYERLKTLVVSEYCGISTASTEILKSSLRGFNWEQFEFIANMRLDNNREQWSKLEKFFGDTSVLDIGMFYYAPTDRKCRELLDKAKIIYTLGSAVGTNDDFGRFNLCQSNELTYKAVQAMLKADKIK